MSLKISRVLFSAASVAGLFLVPVTQAAGNSPVSQSTPPASTRSSAPGAHVRTPDEHGVIGRRVRDVVAEQRTGRRLGAMDPKTIRHANDSDAYIDDDGRIFYADLSLGDHAESGTARALPHSTGSSETPPSTAEGVAPASGSPFALNSRPGSPHTIYLDFDGETVANTAWNSGRVNPKTVPAYDTDANPGSFSATEQQTIRNVWQAVAEDWAPFDINVTTQRPSSDDAFIRSSPSDNVFGAIAVVTPDRWTCTSCGGIAYVDILDGFAGGMAYQYAWVFPSAAWSSSTIANVISHEVGHNFGLSHDGITGSEYYGGTGSWGPIMGNPGRSYVQWSKGEYAGSTNTEDDLGMIGGYAGFAPDSSTSSATAVQIPSAGLTQTSADEVVGSATDVDFHAVDVTNGYLRVTFTRSLYSNLYARMALLNSAGTELATVGLFSGASTILYSASIANGRYYLKTEPVFDSASAGFTTYGSLGAFAWTVTRADTPAMVSASLSPLGDQTFTASWSATSAAMAPYTYTYSLCTATSCGAPAATTATSAALTAPATTGSYFVKVTAANQFGLVSPELASAATSVRSKPIAPTVSKLRWDETTDTVQVEWGNGQEFAPVTVTGHTITVRKRSTSEVVTAAVSGISGTTSLTVPSTWDGVWIDVSIVSATSSPSPWNSSDPSTASMFFGRNSTTSANAAPSPRSAAPPASGSANARTPAPGA